MVSAWVTMSSERPVQSCRSTWLNGSSRAPNRDVVRRTPLPTARTRPVRAGQQRDDAVGLAELLHPEHDALVPVQAHRASLAPRSDQIRLTGGVLLRHGNDSAGAAGERHRRRRCRVPPADHRGRGGRPPGRPADRADRGRWPAAVRRDDRRVLRWVVRSDDAMVGHVVLVLPDLDNEHLAMANVTVHPDHRRRGLGTALLREAVAVAAADGRSTFLAGADDGGAGEAFCRARGLRVVARDRLSLLRLADVDWADVEALAAAAHPGYRLARWTDRCPDELVEQFAVAKTAMNDAPTDDADIGEPGLLRRGDPAGRAGPAGDRLHLVGDGRRARAERCGRRAHRAVLATRQPQVEPGRHGGRARSTAGLVWGCGSRPTCSVRLQAERPDVAALITGNAATNAQMLRINDRLGFRP